MNPTNIESEVADWLYKLAYEYVTTYAKQEDREASVTAVLARAMEVANGKPLKPLEELWTSTTF
jgi:hypothetical protein